MPIQGICHDFAFSRCYDRSEWSGTKSVLPDKDLFAKISKSGYMKKISAGDISGLKSGVLTAVVDKNPMPSHCVHSYYVDEPSKFLLSSNDPFALHIADNSGLVVPTAVTDSVKVAAYSFADFAGVLGASGDKITIGKDKRQFDLYYCDAAAAKLGWWANA